MVTSLSSVHFYSIHRAPRTLPIWHQLLEELSFPEPRNIAKVMGVSLRTVYRWNRTGKAPRSACLALFWLTRYGRSQIHCDAVNDCSLAVQYCAALKTELASAKSQISALLVALGTPGAGGEPPVSHEVAWPELEQS